MPTKLQMKQFFVSLLLFLIIIVSISVHGANFSWYFGKNGNGKEWIVSRNLEHGITYDELKQIEEELKKL